MTIDYEKAAKDQIASADLGTVSKLAEYQGELEQAKIDLQAQLNEVNEELNDIKHTRLPNAMLEVGLSELKLASGAKVTVKPFYSLAIKDKDNKEPAFQWLQDHDAGDMIKVTVTAMFGPDRMADAIALANHLNEGGYDVAVTKDVHPMTLKSWLKNNADLADSIPESLFRVYVGQVANIK